MYHPGKLRKIAGLWIEGSLGPIERASIQSFLKFGHEFTVYAYGELKNVPEGAIVKDAREIMPGERILRYRSNGSSALHANLFRYRLLSKTDFVWVDLDVIALRPFDMATDWIFAQQDANLINNAVLALPKQSKALQYLLRFDENTKGFPPNLDKTVKRRMKLKALFHGKPTIEEWEWGTLGPKGLTHALRRSREHFHARSKNAFYFVPPATPRPFLEPGALQDHDFPPDAYAVHLWNRRLSALLKDEYNNKAPQGSFLADKLSEEWRT